MEVTQQQSRSTEFEYVELILLAILVGVLGALGNLGFRALIDLSMWVFHGLEWAALGIPRGGLFKLLVPVVLLSGGAALLLLNLVFPGDVLGYGFPKFLEIVNLGNARVKRRWIAAKALGAAVSLGAGASVGREGPIAQIGGAIGSAVVRLRRRSIEQTKVLVAAGAGAGIATTFNAPIGGLMFAQEIVLLGEMELGNLTLLIIATMSAVVTERSLMGNAAVFHPTIFVLRSYWELVSYGVMGSLLGALGAAFIRMFQGTADAFKRLQLPQWMKLGLGLMVVGIIVALVPENFADGYPVIDRALAGDFTLAKMGTLTAAKMVACSVSLGCGAPGGVFGPIFFIGTMAGGTFQRLSALIVPRLTGPRGSYALVGLGAFLSGVTHAPLTALFLLFEMTQDYQVALPAMIAAVTSLLVARYIVPFSIDVYALARAGKELEVGKERQILMQIPVAAVMAHDVTVVHPNDSLAAVLSAAGETHQATLPVVDSDGECTGAVAVRDLLAVLGRGSDLGPLVNAHDLASRGCCTVGPEASLDEAAQLMEREGIDEIAVTDSAAGGKLLGLVSRQHVAQALSRMTVSLSSLATRDSNIFWANGYRVTRVIVPPAAHGKTLRALNTRARFGVSVLAVRGVSEPSEGFVPIAADRPLQRGDLIAVAGRPAALRGFMRELEGGTDRSGNKGGRD